MSKQRIEEALRGDKSNKIFAPFLAYYWDFLPEAVRKKGETEYCNNVLKCDSLLRGAAMAWKVQYDQYAVEERVEDQIKSIIYRTPLGELKFVYKYADVSNSWFLIKHPVKTELDFEILKYIFIHTHICEDIDNLNKLYRSIGDSALLVPVIGLRCKSAYQDLCENWCGLQNLVEAMCDFPDKVEECITELRRINLETVKITARALPEYCISWEDSTTMFVSPSMYEKYIIDELNEWCDILHANGKKYILHACGHIQNLLPIIAKSKIDVLESITPAPVGDADLKYADEILPDNIAIIGGIDGITLKNSSKEEILKKVDELYQIFRKRGYVLANSDSCPPEVKEESLKTISEYVSKNLKK